MPSRRESRKDALISKELIEADVDIGFSLVDTAETESVRGNSAVATRALQDAEMVFADIERRLLRLEGATEGEAFQSLVGELRRQIDLAKSHIPSPLA